MAQCRESAAWSVMRARRLRRVRQETLENPTGGVAVPENLKNPAKLSEDQCLDQCRKNKDCGAVLHEGETNATTCPPCRTRGNCSPGPPNYFSANRKRPSNGAPNVRRLAIAATIAVALGAFAINYTNVQAHHAKKCSLLKNGEDDDKVYTIRIDEKGKITYTATTRASSACPSNWSTARPCTTRSAAKPPQAVGSPP